MSFWSKLKEFFCGEEEPKYSLSARGECMLIYCRRIVNGEDVYIEAYEEELIEFGKKFNMDRKAAAIAYIELLEEIERTGCI